MTRPFLLNARASSTCPRVTHNQFDETVDAVEWVPSKALKALFAHGVGFEDDLVQVQLVALGQQARDLRPLNDDPKAHTAATIAAMAEGIPVIVGGRLPNDFVGHRAGKPDLLVRSVDASAGGPGYVPADIKAHTFATSGKGVLVWSNWTDAAPEQAYETPGLRPDITRRQPDVLQLAHYWRMLEACDRAAGRSPIGAIVGKDEVDGNASPLIWVALNTPLVWTFSRTTGKKKRSALERYDHEHGFRVQVAEVARKRSGSADDPAPLVRPIYEKECESCSWHDVCLPLMDGDPSVVSDRLDRRGWQALAAAGVTSVDGLASLEPDCLDDPGCEPSPDVAAVLALYLREVSHRPRARAELAAASHRARMIHTEVRLERTTCGPIELPEADVNIDFDIEWSYDHRVYLWGFLVTSAPTDPAYHPVASWTQLDDVTEAELAASAWTWLSGQAANAEQAGQRLLVWHYSNPEISYWRKIIERSTNADLPTTEVFNGFVDDHFVDLNRFTRQHLRGLDGLGLKNVAADGPAFSWRDEDPGGQQSQAWHADSLLPDDPAAASAARTRVLQYNEDDVLATKAVRDWLRALDR